MIFKSRIYIEKKKLLLTRKSPKTKRENILLTLFGKKCKSTAKRKKIGRKTENDFFFLTQLKKKLGFKLKNRKVSVTIDMTFLA